MRTTLDEEIRVDHEVVEVGAIVLSRAEVGPRSPNPKGSVVRWLFPFTFSSKHVCTFADDRIFKN